MCCINNHQISQLLFASQRVICFLLFFSNIKIAKSIPSDADGSVSLCRTMGVEKRRGEIRVTSGFSEPLMSCCLFQYCNTLSSKQNGFIIIWLWFHNKGTFMMNCSHNVLPKGLPGLVCCQWQSSYKVHPNSSACKNCLLVVKWWLYEYIKMLLLM